MIIAMKKLPAALFSFAFCLKLLASDADVVAFYKGVTPATGAKALTSSFDETKFCYEYSMHSEVVLKVESKIGLTKGKIIF